MPVKRDLLIQAVASPDSLAFLPLSDWDRLIREARRVDLLARLGFLLVERGLLESVPTAARTHLEAARVIAENEDRVMRWEINRIERALAGVDVPIVLLKGAAYAAAGLPVARGRLSSDVDILVPKDEIRLIEARLIQHNWRHVKLDEYDQRFYRTWSHELPPLQHRDRQTIIDVHHTILPPMGRLHPDPKKLLAAAVRVDGSRFKVLAPADMVLHSAAHGFQDGDFQRGVRDLLDVNDLLRDFGSRAGFWDELVLRAEELELSRPLCYALRYTRLFLATPIPEYVFDVSRRWQPLPPVQALMDRLVANILRPKIKEAFTSAMSRRLLYIRAHWLRMPPPFLARHLLHQTIRRLRSADKS